MSYRSGDMERRVTEVMKPLKTTLIKDSVWVGSIVVGSIVSLSQALNFNFFLNKGTPTDKLLSILKKNPTEL